MIDQRTGAALSERNRRQRWPIRLEYLLEASLKRLEVLAASPWLERVRLILVSDASTAD